LRLHGVWDPRRFRVLVWIIGVAGLTQGLTIPLLTTLLEERGVSPSLNGLSAASLYFGILVMTPLCAGIVGRLGYKHSIMAGLGATLVSTFLFPLFSGVWMWTVLRFFLGMGDSLLHYSTQLWITTTAPENERGRRISQYGFAYGLGFGIGPLGMNLLPWGEWVPFAAMFAVLLTALWGVMRLDTAFPETDGRSGEWKKGASRLAEVYRIGLVALCPAALYGFLEAALAGNFPVVGLREGISRGWVSLLIAAFVWGSLLLQVPLGLLGDRIGRKRLLIIICTLGAAGMAMIPFLMPHEYALAAAFALTGGLLGSLFSLGLAYLTDILPSGYLPVANAVSSIHFSVGSLLGPYLGGLLVQWMGGSALFYFLSAVLASFVLLAAVYRVPGGEEMEPAQQKEAV
jgi:MFS family permease